jgi:Ferritin-like
MANTGKIFPRNLTARAAYQIVGNPDSTRPEDAVGNCYPGLEADLRNLDRRFFPGLVFNFVARRDIDAPYTDKHRYGALLAYTDPWGDTDLQPDAVARLEEGERSWVQPLAGPLLAALTGDQGDSLATGEWYIDWIEQSERHLSMMQVMPDGSKSGLDGLFVWRLVRGLERGPVTIALTRRDRPAPPIILHGWRRFFTNTRTGVISEAYQPGELTQALCSPWQHDFRDCSCHYWPANRPDIVHLPIAAGEPVLPDGEAGDPARAMMLVDWMRADRAREVTGAALNTMPVNRPYQMDYYQINRTWQDLSMVIGNTEIGARYMPPTADTAEPYGSPDELAAALRDRLAPVEMTLAIEYLYARFSLLTAEETAGSPWAELADDVTFVRHMLMLTAGSEMLHLRWSNELLWRLAEAGLIKEYSPVLTLSADVPCRGGKSRPRRLCRLDTETLTDFIAVEAPKGKLEADYSRAVATLRAPTYPPHLSELAGRIVSDGLQHYTRLRDVRGVLARYATADPPYPYLRELQLGTPEQTTAALTAYRDITAKLSRAYSLLAQGDFANAGRLIADSRAAMNTLLDEGERLAKQAVGIPFW